MFAIIARKAIFEDRDPAENNAKRASDKPGEEGDPKNTREPNTNSNKHLSIPTANRREPSNRSSSGFRLHFDH
jgi:hypothetical protein